MNWMAPTMSDAESFEKTWRADLAAGNLGVQLVDVGHPLEIYVGASDLGAPRLQLRSKSRPRVPKLSEVVVADRASHGEAWLVTLTLQEKRFTEVFIRLASDVISRSRSAPNEQEALAIVDLVFDEWRRLLKPRPLHRLGIDELRGLVGELWLVLERFVPRMAVEEAIGGWFGPLGAPQDFWYATSGFHEAKSIGATAAFIEISSAEQLDQPNMELIVLRVPQVSESADGAVTLVTLVQRVADLLDAAQLDHSELETRLKRLGVDLTDPYYAETWFAITAETDYVVEDAFPAIRASKLDLGVSNVTYRLAVGAIGAFQQVNTEHGGAQ